jgi:hypothetical protein
MKAKLLFLINYYNDVDHTAPLILEFLERGHHVSVTCLTQFNLRKDVRIRDFTKYKNFSIHPLKYLPRNKGISNKNPGNIKLFGKIWREIFFNVIWAAMFLKRWGFEAIIFTWGRPMAKGLQRRIFQAATHLGLPTICIPHGQNIYINYDVNTEIYDIHRLSGHWPDFSDRNHFTKYIVQTQRHRQQHIDWGMDPEKVSAWGSLRFDPSWVNKNIGYYTQGLFPMISNKTNSFRIVFFLPHWRYNVDASKTLKLIKAILSRSDGYLIIKGHTRGDQIDQDMQLQFNSYDNVEINSMCESTPLIDWADVVVNFGSSIALEAIVRNKRIIYPSYLHSNQTIFDGQGCVEECKSINEVIDTLDLIQKHKLPAIDESEKSKILISEVFADTDGLNIPQLYAKNILALLRR